MPLQVAMGDADSRVRALKLLVDSRGLVLAAMHGLG